MVINIWIKKYMLRPHGSLPGEMLSCGYCLGHWTAFALTAVYKPKILDSWWLTDYIFTSLIIAWLGAFQWALLCHLMDQTGK